jgi:hypothetical protein
MGNVATKAYLKSQKWLFIRHNWFKTKGKNAWEEKKLMKMIVVEDN